MLDLDTLFVFTENHGRGYGSSKTDEIQIVQECGAHFEQR